MCIIIRNPSGKKIKHEYLKNSYDHNKDGLGFMWNHNGKIRIKKILPKNFEEVEKAYNSILKLNSQFWIHFRSMSAGNVSLENVHPFKVSKNVALMHNGTIHAIKREYIKDSSASDTANLAKMLSFYKNDNFFMDPGFQHLFARAINSSRIVIANNKGNFMYTFPDKWEKENGFLFSSGYYKKEKVNYSYQQTNMYSRSHHNTSNVYKPFTDQFDGDKKQTVYGEDGEVYTVRFFRKSISEPVRFEIEVNYKAFDDYTTVYIETFSPLRYYELTRDQKSIVDDAVKDYERSLKSQDEIEKDIPRWKQQEGILLKNAKTITQCRGCFLDMPDDAPDLFCPSCRKQRKALSGPKRYLRMA